MLETKDILVIGMGNTIRGDDGAGILALRELKARLGRTASQAVDFIEFEESNINLLHEIPGYKKIIIIDSISTGKAPIGQILKINCNDFQAFGTSYSTHQLGIPRIFAIAKELGLAFSDDVAIFAIEINKNEAFCEDISDAVSFSIKELVNLIEIELTRNIVV